MVKKYFPALVAALLAFVAFGANAGLGRINPEEQAFRNNNGEYLTIKSNGNAEAYSAVISAIEKSGYYATSNDTVAGTRIDRWCKVDIIYRDWKILGECYTPHIWRGVAVRDYLDWSHHSEVTQMVAKLRDNHQRATKALNKGQTKVLFVPTY